MSEFNDLPANIQSIIISMLPNGLNVIRRINKEIQNTEFTRMYYIQQAHCISFRECDLHRYLQTYHSPIYMRMVRTIVSNITYFATFGGKRVNYCYINRYFEMDGNIIIQGCRNFTIYDGRFKMCLNKMRPLNETGTNKCGSDPITMFRVGRDRLPMEYRSSKEDTYLINRIINNMLRILAQPFLLLYFRGIGNILGINNNMFPDDYEFSKDESIPVAMLAEIEYLRGKIVPLLRDYVAHHPARK